MLNLDEPATPPEIPNFNSDLVRLLRSVAQRRTRSRAVPRRAIAATAIAVVVAGGVAIGIETTGGPSPATNPGRTTPPLSLAAFSVDREPGGMVTLTVNRQQLFNPAALRRALAKAGVPALVTVGSVCYVPGPVDALPQVITAPQPQPNGSVITTITPSAIPAGMRLSFGFYTVSDGGGLHVGLVPTHGRLTCTPTPPASYGPGQSAG